MRKVDANQKEIVTALRRFGASVQSLADIGKGCPDLIVGYKGITYLMECKDGEKYKSQQKLTPCQVDWIGSWLGSPVAVVSSVDEAIKAIT